MAVMQRMRDNTHIILWGLLILFLASMTIGGLVGGADLLDIFSQKSRLKDAAGIVDGKKLDAQRYSQLIQNELDNYRDRSQELNEADIDQISEQIWQSYINETLIGKQIEKFKIKASDSEIYEVLLKNPPQILQQNEAFQTDGKFDYQKYQDAINHPQGNEWLAVEEYMRNYLPYEKMQNLIESLAMVSDAEITGDLTIAKTTADFTALVVPYAIVAQDTFPITKSEISKYYSKEKKRFLVPETRTLDYVVFDTRPTPADSFSTFQQLESIRGRLARGEDFATVAAEVTEEPGGAANGGDLGWFGKNQMVPEFDRAAFTLGKGQISRPIVTQFGVHLIKVEDKRIENGQPQVKARHILLKFKTGPETLENIRSQANLFAYDANEYGFQAAADSMKLAIKNTGPIAKDARYINFFGTFAAGIRFAYSNKPIGTISEVLSYDNGITVLHLAGINEEHYRPLEEVREQIKNILSGEKRVEKLQAIGNEIYAQAANDNQLESVVAKYPGCQVDTYTGQSINSTLKNVQRSGTISGTLLGLKPGQISKPLLIANRTIVIIKLNARKDVKPEEIAAEIETYRQQMLARKKSSIYTNWVNALKDQVKIVDNRANLY